MTLCVAALDLGSNSFHLAIAEVRSGKIHSIHRESIRVRLAAGLNRENQLSKRAIQRALRALSEFGQRLREHHIDHIQCVATHTFRTASNLKDLHPAAEQRLGHPIRVLSGDDEARLIYSGVYSEHPTPGQRLMIDIGGGSTEIALGDSALPRLYQSIPVGCVTYTQQFFRNRKLSEDAFQRAIQSCTDILKARLQPEIQTAPFVQVYGSSGTIRSLVTCAKTLKLSKGPLTPATLEDIKTHLLLFPTSSAVHIAGVGSDRADLLCGGLAILIGVTKLFDVTKLTFSQSALREGLLLETAALAQGLNNSLNVNLDEEIPLSIAK